MSLLSSKKRGNENPVITVLAQIFTIFLCIFMLYPLFWMILSSLKTVREIFNSPWSFPEIIKWSNYINAWQSSNFGWYFLNSIIITTVAVTIIIVFAIFASFAFARLKFAGKEIFFYLFLSGIMVPVQVVLIPLFLFFRRLGLTDSYQGIILAYSAWGLPFAIFLLRSYFATIPKELSEAAKIDGCSDLKILLLILVPVIKPSLLAVTIYSGINIWNEFLFALVFLTTDKMKTLPVGISTFVGEHTVNYPLLFAGLTIMVLPLFILYLIFQRQFIEGLTAGAVKM